MTAPRLALAAIALAVLAPVASAQLPPLVERALATVEMQNDRWAYTQTSTDSDGRSVATFDPSRPAGKQWQLVSVDGRKPTADEVAEFAEKKAKRKSRGARTEGELKEMIRPGSLRLVRETPAQSVYEFRLPADDEEERATIDVMKGRLTISRAGAWLQSLELENEKPMKPAKGVNIQRMYTRMTFLAPAGGNPPLLGEVRVTVKGRLFFVKTIDQDGVSTYSDYRRVTAAR